MIDSMIDDLVNFTADSTFMETITKTAADYDNLIYTNIVMKFMKDVSFGIGASLLCLFMLMELVAIVQRSDSGGGMHSLQIPANILIKWGIYTFLFCRLNVILEGIQGVAVEMANNAAISGSAPNVALLQNADNIKQTIKDLNLVEELFADLIVMIVWLIFNLFKSLISVLMVFRMFELWIMIMFAPIPLATLPAPEFRQTAINYIKSFAALCLTGVIIIASFMLFSNFVGHKIAAIPITANFLVFAQNILLILGYVSVLVVTVFNAGRISKSIMNAM